jgi:2,3-dimethylmalate lyase
MFARVKDVDASRRLLRALLAADELAVFPGAYDALSARLIQNAGFPGVYATGAGIARSLGYPDLGLVTATEMVQRIGVLVDAVDLPVLADADTGYGNALNVMRTVAAYERAGVAGLHLEDQVTPKRCGHYAGKNLVSITEMVGKLDAALTTRGDSSLVVIARTDALAVEGIDEALVRLKAYSDTGVDAVFLAAPTEAAHIKSAAEVVSCPLILNLLHGGKTPMLPHAELTQLGLSLVTYSAALQLAACEGMRAALDELRAAPGGAVLSNLMPFERRDELSDFSYVTGLESEYVRD